MLTLFKIIIIASLANFSFARLTFENILSTSNTDFVNFTCTIGANQDGHSYLNVSILFKYDISQMTVQFTFAVPKDKNDKNYERVILKSTVNTCKMAQGVLGDFLSKMVTESMGKAKTVNKKTCIHPKGLLELHNYVLPDKYLPTFLLSYNLKYYIISKIMGKVPNQKGYVHLFTAKAFGEIIKD